VDIRIKKTHPDAIIPTRQKPGDSGLDLCACLPDGPVWVKSGEHRVIPTGIAIELPPPPLYATYVHGWEAQVRPRSGLAANRGIVGAFGTIDSGYRGEVGVNLFNHSWVAFKVSHGDRIAQLVIVPVVYPSVVEVDQLSETERGVDGFGSTGI
jgi:dUTP pyrophosphatase